MSLIFWRNHFIDDPTQKVSQEKFNAIASCLAIRRRVFENYKFDERLFVIKLINISFVSNDS